MYLIIFIGIALFSFIAQNNLRNTFKKYSKIPVIGGARGCDVALKMLHDNGIKSVKVICVDGYLTDHYDPIKKSVSLSSDVYNGSNITAAAVAAHECGHAVQHAKAYAPLRIRSVLVPVVSFASRWVTWILLLGIFLMEVYPQIMIVGIVLFALTTAFTFVTLPVEIDASRRALSWLGRSGFVDSRTAKPAEEALRSAAYTYVVAALASLGTLIYYIKIFMGRRS